MSENNKKLQLLLQSVGLDEKEALVYLAMLELGETTILKISERSGVKRATVYTIITRLTQKGVVSEIHKGFKKQYVAESPRRLESLLQEQAQKLQESLPELLALHTYPSSEQSVKVYEGLEGLKNGLNSALEGLMPGDEYYVIANIESILEMAPQFFKTFAKKRSEYNITLKTLLQDGPLTREYAIWAEHTREEIKFLPKGQVLNANIVVTSHRIVMPHIKPFVGAVVIENSQAVDTHMKLFHMLWDSQE